jgi:hypothetical protein
MSFELRHIPPANLHAWWGEIVEDLDTCRVQDTDTVWREDVYACIRFGTATLHVGLVNGAYAGFVILTTKSDTFNGAQHVHVWFCANHEGFDILKLGQAELEAMARRMNASKITLRASRHGFEKLLRPLGYTVAEIEFVKELSDG